MEQSDADQIVTALRGFDPNFHIIGNIPAGEFILCIRRLQDQAEELRATLSAIGDMAHDASTGPAVPDVLWEIRCMAYGSP